MVFERSYILNIKRSLVQLSIFVGIIFSVITANGAELSDGSSLFTDSAVDINSEEMFSKQTSRGTCTLVSTTMMLKRRAALDNMSYWETVTEETVRQAAWLGGVGLRFEFVFEDYKVIHMGLSGDTQSKKEQLIKLLKEHPEGIVAYDSNLPHAILLTDYEEKEDTFYCSDPADYYPEGRYSVLLSYLGEKRGSDNQDNVIGNITAYWYIKEKV